MRYPIRPPALLTVFAALAFFCSAPEILAQEGTSSLTVHMRTAQDGRPLAGGQVIVQGIGISGPTRADGTVHLERLSAGTRTVEVHFLGYASQRAQVTLEPGRSSQLHFALEVDPIRLAEVKVRVPPSRLLRTGFFQRRSAGFGTFFTREEIVRMHPLALSDVMHRVAGATVFRSRSGLSSANLRGGTGRCPVQFFVDGTMTSYFLIDEVRPEDVEGIEIYRGAATLPPEYNKGTAICGLIVIWTRDR
jgi:hypothetical protein